MEKKKNIYQKFMWWVAKVFVFPKPEIVGEMPEGDDPVVFVANHAQAFGPGYMTLYFNKPHKTWIINYVLDKKKNVKFIYHDFFYVNTKKHKKAWHFLARIVALALRPLIMAIDYIPVYHDQRMMTTFRQSTDALVSGENLVIFGECPKRYSEFVHELYAGFTDLGRSYYTATGKNLRFCPVYICGDLRKICIGEPIEYDGKASPKTQRKELTEKLRDGIDALGRSLPKHTPTQFLPDEWYGEDAYGKYENDPMAYWHTYDE